VTYGGYLAELREYTPMHAGTGLAGYRHCHECQLISPHLWPEKDKEQRMAHEWDGWMTCGLCRRSVPPARPLTADTAQPCPDCATAAHLADQALGNLDPTDPATCQQIADLITAALPGVDLDAGVRLLLHLAGCDVDLTPAAINDLIRSVKNTGQP
jgi:hypothetical protein